MECIVFLSGFHTPTKTCAFSQHFIIFLSHVPIIQWKLYQNVFGGLIRRLLIIIIIIKKKLSVIGVGRFRILGGGARFRIFGGGGARGPNSQQAHDVVTTSMRRNVVASTSFRRRVPTRFLINQCQIITFLILKYDIIENSRIELRGIVLPVQVG